jgi:hypothetical protein
MKLDMTLAEVLSDPLIDLLNAADKVDQRQFAQMMESAARVLTTRKCANCKNRTCAKLAQFENAIHHFPSRVTTPATVEKHASP